MSAPKRSPDLCDVEPVYNGGFSVVFTWGSWPNAKRVRVHLTDSMAEHTARQVIRAMKRKRDNLRNDIVALRDEAAS